MAPFTIVQGDTVPPSIFRLRNISQAGRFAPVTTPDPGGGKSPGPMRYAGLGIQLAVILVIFVFAGQWADRKLGTGGIITIVAAFLGFGGTMYSLIRTLNKKDGGGE